MTMPKKPDDDKSDKDKPETRGDKFGKWFYRDSDTYDWSGKKTEDGWDTRKKGSDR